MLEGLSSLERLLSLSLRKQAMTLLLQLMVTIFNERERGGEGENGGGEGLPDTAAPQIPLQSCQPV